MKKMIVMLLCLSLTVLAVTVNAHRPRFKRDPLCRDVERLMRDTERRSDIQGYQLHQQLVDWHGYYCEVD